MPNHKEHCQLSLKLYGKTFSDLHKWMDEPSIMLGSQHRILRHDIKHTPAIAKEIFGDMADQACITHIIQDFKAKEIIKLDCYVLPSSKHRRVIS